MPKIIQIATVLILSYLMGSIPFGALLGNLSKIDIRRLGSGNIGATNVLRVLGTLPAIIVFILDILKGTLTVALAKILNFDPAWTAASGIAAIFGHMFSIFLGFKGGKGVSTSFGVLLLFAPDIALFGFIFAVILIAATRYVSLASIITSIFVAILMFGIGKPLPYSYAATIAVLLIIYKHIPNIKRLIAGTESKIGEN